MKHLKSINEFFNLFKRSKKSQPVVFSNEVKAEKIKQVADMLQDIFDEYSIINLNNESNKSIYGWSFYKSNQGNKYDRIGMRVPSTLYNVITHSIHEIKSQIEDMIGMDIYIYGDQRIEIIGISFDLPHIRNSYIKK